ncbi:MAG: ParA family protein [Alsobacter sp.]
MRVISFVSHKGGTGKSTLAVNLAVIASAFGENVVVIDLDSQETTASWFWSRRSETPCLAPCRTADGLPDQLQSLSSSGVSLVVIDTPGSNPGVAETAARASDLCLVPLRPSEADVRAVMPTLRSLAAIRRPFALVLNQVPPRLAPGGSPRIGDPGAVLPVAIGARIDHQHSYALGLGVAELSPAGKAAAELRALWQEVRTRLPPGPPQRACVSVGRGCDDDGPWPHAQRPGRSLAVNARPDT